MHSVIAATAIDGGWQSFVISLLISTLCGMVIGIERESKRKPAGIRTLVLISVGSTLFVHVSLLLAGSYGDPARVAAQIVTGIGFLGAGAILQKSESGYIAGLTTAASIWVTAAIGMIVGAGFYVLAIVSMVIVVIGLKLLRIFETAFFHRRHIELKRIQFVPNSGKSRWTLLGLIEENMIHPREYRFNLETENQPELLLDYVDQNRAHRTLLAQLAHRPEVIRII